MRVVCIIQARAGSTRLPGKVLKKICGKTVLEHDINRLKVVCNIDEIIIATTTEKQDDKIVEEAIRIGVKYYRGSINDVLSRYFYAAKENYGDIIVRVTSDCPCMDSNIIENIINDFKIYSCSGGIDYISNTIERTFPRGYDVEVFTFAALEKAFFNATQDYEKEHVTPYLYDLKNKFKIKMYKNNIDYSEYRVTLDTEEDFKVIGIIFDNLYDENNNFHLEDVVRFLNDNPDVVKINSGIEQKKLGE